MRAYKPKEIAIFDAAWKLFTAKGFYETKISEVASEAGIGKGTVYEYFKSKEELVQEMIVYFLHASITELETTMEGIDNPEEKLIYMTRHDLAKGLDLFKTMKVLQMIASFDRSVIKDTVMQMMARRANISMTVIEEGMIAGVFKKDDPFLTTLMYSGIINNAMMMYHTPNSEALDPDALVAFILRKLK